MTPSQKAREELPFAEVCVGRYVLAEEEKKEFDRTPNPKHYTP